MPALPADTTAAPVPPPGMPDTAATSGRQWVGLGLVAVLVALICGGLGVWQWQRHEARAKRVAAIEAAYDAPPVATSDLATPAGELRVPADSVQWRPVSASGRFTGNSVLVRNRPVGHGAGFHVLGVFESDDGSAWVVNRGFLPTSLPASQVSVPSPPGGHVDLVARVRPAEPANSRGVSGNQIYTFSPDQVVVAAGLTSAPDGFVLDAYLVADTALASGPGLVPIPAPETDQGPHLSYAFQWWTFTVGVLGAYAVLFAREHRGKRVTLDDLLAPGDLDADGAAASTAGWSRLSSSTSAARVAHRHSDEEDEDAQISAQLR